MSLPQTDLFHPSSHPNLFADTGTGASDTAASPPHHARSNDSASYSPVDEKRANVDDSTSTTRSLTTAIKRVAKKTSQRPNADQNRERFLRRPEVQHLTGLSRSSLYRLIAVHEFPRPINVSKNAVAWLSSSIDEWMAARVAAAQHAQAAKSQGK
jgi:prophage regulatory protein